jgi:nucleotide-binding universal stress UspA family protein
MKNILFPTDFSRNAKNAMAFALELAKKEKSKLILFNAYQLPYNRADMMVSVLGILKEDSEAGLRNLVEEIQKNPVYSELELEAISRVGDVVSTVNEIVKEKAVDLIVMGTKGESGIVEAIIGSNTTSVIKNVDCPILSVPEHASYVTPKEIAFAYDLKEVEDKKDIKFLASLVKSFDAKLQIYSVIPTQEKETVERPVAQQRMNEDFQGLDAHVHFAVNADIIEGIRDLIDAHNPDWMVMVAKKYTLFESLFHTSMTKQMVFQTEKPLLILHNFNSKV